MIGVLRLFRIGTRIAEWATPHVKKWHRERHLNRTEGERHLQASNFDLAEKHLTLAVGEAEKRKYSTGARITLRLQLADSQRLQGKLADAERSVRTAILDAIHERDIPMQAVCTDALAEVLLAGGDFRGAEQTLQEAFALESSLAKPDLKAGARRARLLATARQKDGRPAEAIAALEKIVPLLEQIYGAAHIETANVLSEVGALQRSVGQHAEAQQNLRRALRIHESSGQSDSREATRDLAHLAASLEETGDLDGAAAQYERALKMKERQVGVNIEEVAEMQLKVAQLYVHWKRFGPARELLTHAIGRLENKKGPRLPVALEEMAKLEEASGRTAEAARLRERAILVAAGIAT